jgi:transposase-like protein
MTERENQTKWLRDTEVAGLLNVAPGTLRNWRTEDRKTGRLWPQAGHAGLRWRKFGKSVRYLIDAELLGGAPAAAGVERDADRG